MPDIVTVFGGSGFLGARIVKQLVTRGSRVRVAVRHPEGVDLSDARNRVSVVTADIQDSSLIVPALKDSVSVINVVGHYVQTKAISFDAVHAIGAENLAWCAAQAGVARLVHVSGIGADINSPSAYVRSRAKGESLVREAFPEATIMRPSAIFGPGDALFSSLEAISRRLPVIPLFGRGQTRLQPVFVDDVANAVAVASSEPSTVGKTYELGGPKVYTYRALVEFLLDTVKRRRVLLPIPYAVWEAIAVSLAVLPNPPLTWHQVVLMRDDNVVGQGSLTLSDLGIQPTTVETQLADYIR